MEDGGSRSLQTYLFYFLNFHYFFHLNSSLKYLCYNIIPGVTYKRMYTLFMGSDALRVARLLQVSVFSTHRSALAEEESVEGLVLVRLTHLPELVDLLYSQSTRPERCV